MGIPSKTLSEQQINCIMEQLWLHYYNETLLNKGLITAREYLCMKRLINSRKTCVANG
jgi:hypothetical protein